jgi:hypothetical protein
MYVLFVTGTRIRFEYREMQRKKQEEKRSCGFTTLPRCRVDTDIPAMFSGAWIYGCAVPS